MPFIARGGNAQFTVPAGSTLIVSSAGAGITKVYYGQVYPAGNLPNAYSLQAIVATGVYNSGSLAAAQAVRIEASFACDVEYEFGTAPMFTQSVINAAFNSNTATASTTLTAANVSGGDATVDLALTGTLGGAANATLPTVASLVAALGSPIIGASYRLRIVNESSGAFAWTVVTNTGWTLTGTMTIAQNTWREFVVTLTSATTATLQNVATGTFS